MSERKPGRSTQLVEGGRRKQWRGRLVNPPVERTSTILFDSVAEMAATGPGLGTYRYGLQGTATQWALAEALTELEPGAAGTALFSSIANGDNAAPVWAKITAGVVSALAGVLAAIQTFMKFSERAEKHAVAADWLAAIRRDLEVVSATPEAARGDPTVVLAKLRKEINRIAQSAPAIGEQVWHRFATEYQVKEPKKG